MHYLLFTFLGFCLINAAHSESHIVFSSSTEDSTIGWSFPSEQVAKKIVNIDKVDREDIDEKISDDGLKKNYRQFFALKKLRLSSTNELFSFVRPRSEIYSTFYGAHIFRYWVLDRNNEIIFSGAGDHFSVASAKHNNKNDLVATSCFRGYCYATTYIFDGNEYKSSSCLARSMIDEKVTKACE